MNRRLFSKTCATVTIVIVGVFASIPAKLQKEWEVADTNVRRLQPRAFAQLPVNILQYLDAHRCTIPQYYADGRPHNVIRGEFARRGQPDWAVLCSRKKVSSILVFWKGDVRKRSEIARFADKNFLQADGGGITFSRTISAVDRKYILDHYQAYGGPKPPPINHQGIDDGFIGKASVVRYFARGHWLRLQGAD